jgi:hypothetical protein
LLPPFGHASGFSLATIRFPGPSGGGIGDVGTASVV